MNVLDCFGMMVMWILHGLAIRVFRLFCGFCETTKIYKACGFAAHLKT